MFKLGQLAAIALVASSFGAPVFAFQATGGAPAVVPGGGNSANVSAANREENASYNRLIGKVGSDPVKQEKARAAALAKPVPATPADIVAGAPVRDVKGVALGKVESIDGDSAILAFTTGKIRFPLIGFGKDAQGLLINMTTQDFLAAVAKAKTSS